MKCPWVAIAALILVQHAEAQDRPSSGPDSTIYRIVLDSLYRNGEVLLVRQFYSRESAAPARAGGTLEASIAPSPRVQWVDSSAVVTRNSNGAGVIRYAVQMTRVTYVADGGTALLYIRDVCGGLCGSEREVVLVRDLHNQWRILGLVTTAVY